MSSYVLIRSTLKTALPRCNLQSTELMYLKNTIQYIFRLCNWYYHSFRIFSWTFLCCPPEKQANKHWITLTVYLFTPENYQALCFLFIGLLILNIWYKRNEILCDLWWLVSVTLNDICKLPLCCTVQQYPFFYPKWYFTVYINNILIILKLIGVCDCYVYMLLWLYMHVCKYAEARGPYHIYIFFW